MSEEKGIGRQQELERTTVYGTLIKKGFRKYSHEWS
jgi:hypothetical protein